MPHCLSSPHLQFLICISRCCRVSGVFRLCCLGGRQHSWSGAPVNGICHSFSLKFMSRQGRERRCTVTLKNESPKFQFFNPPNSSFSAFLSYRILWTDPYGTHTTLKTSWIVILLFLWRTSSTQSTYSSILLDVGILSVQNLQKTSHHFQTWKITHKIVFPPPLFCSLRATSNIPSVSVVHTHVHKHTHTHTHSMALSLCHIVWCGTSHKHTNIHNFYSVKYYKHFAKQYYSLY